jgi:exosortase
MRAKITREGVEIGLFCLIIAFFILSNLIFFRQLFDVWMEDIEFSHGILVPPIVAYLVWCRRRQIIDAKADEEWLAGLTTTVLGCILSILASVSSNLLLWSAAFAVSLIGIVGFLWGRARQRIVTTPLLFLTLMAPIPSYVLGQLSWQLKVLASSISSALLRTAGIPVHQDGNLLRLPNYVLEVREACSGTRSLFALLALAIVLGLTSKQTWWRRLLLAALAPLLAVFGNVIRIVGAGLIASHSGKLAENESLHYVWGIVVFLMSVFFLLGFQRLMRWQRSESVQ